LVALPLALELDRLAWSLVLRLDGLEKVKDVLSARSRPQGKEMVVLICERATAADRHKTRVAVFREDHKPQY